MFLELNRLAAFRAKEIQMSLLIEYLGGGKQKESVVYKKLKNQNLEDLEALSDEIFDDYSKEIQNLNISLEVI